MQNNKTVRIEGFEVNESGRYVIQIAAAVSKNSDMSLQIDNISFREIPSDKNTQRFNIPASWNGAILKGQVQTNVYILNLEGGKHELRFTIVNGQATHLRYNIDRLTDQSRIKFDPNLVANSLERQPLINFIIINEPLAQVSAQVSTCWHFDRPVRGDGDDVKLLIDGEVCTDDDRYSWMWHASSEQEDLEKTEFKTVYPMLDRGIHYIEFIADRSPKIHKVIIDTEVHFEGDYLCQTGIRNVNQDKNAPPEYKAVIGVYVPSGDASELNNQNVELYYRNKQVPVKDNKQSYFWETAFDFSGRWLEKPDKKWFYYGIDTSWMYKRMLLNDFDFLNSANWKLIRKKD